MTGRAHVDKSHKAAGGLTAIIGLTSQMRIVQTVQPHWPMHKRYSQGLKEDLHTLPLNYHNLPVSGESIYTPHITPLGVW